MIVRFIANMLDHMQAGESGGRLNPSLPAQRITFPDPLFDRYLRHAQQQRMMFILWDVQFSKHGFRPASCPLPPSIRSHPGSCCHQSLYHSDGAGPDSSPHSHRRVMPVML